MGAVVLDSGVKPEQWGLDPDLVAPEWGWFWDGLIGAWPFWEGGGAIGNLAPVGALSTINGSPSWVGSKFGVVQNFSGASDYHIVDSTQGLLMTQLNDGNADDWSIFCICKNPGSSLDGGRVLYSERDSVGGIEILKVGMASTAIKTNGWEITLRNSSSQLLQLGSTSTPFTDTDWHFILSEVKGTGGSGNAKIFIDDPFSADNSGDWTNANTFNDANQDTQISADSFDAPAHWSGDVALIVAWSRILSDTERIDLFDNPFGSFLMTDEAVFFVPAAGDTTISVPQDSLAETDNVPALNTGVTVPTPQDALTETDNVPALNTGVNVPAPQDSLSQADQTPDLRTGVNVPVPQDVQTQTDNAPTVPQIVGVPADSLSQADSPPDVRTGVNVAVPQDALSETDNTPVIQTAISVPQDSQSQIDNAPTIGTDIQIDVPQDSLAQIDNDPAANTGVTVEPPQDSLAQNDNAPMASTGVLIPVPTDTLSVVDNDPGIAGGARVDAPADVLSIADQAPDLRTGVNIAIPANDNLTITDFAPVIIAADAGAATGGGLIVAPWIKRRRIATKYI